MSTQNSPPGLSPVTTPAINKGLKRPQEDTAAEARREARRQKLIALYTLTPEQKAEDEQRRQEFEEHWKEYERVERARTWEDLIKIDRTNFEEGLRSKSSALYLESCPSYRSHCRATFCLPNMLSGRPNIESSYRFNLRDLTGARKARDAWYPQPNAYFHITCIEQVLDLPAFAADMLASPEYLYSEILKINDWLESGFKSIEGHPCQFSEVLASVDEAEQIDHLPSTLLRLLTKPLAEEELKSIISSDNLTYSKTTDGQSGKAEEPSEALDPTPMQIPTQPTTPLQLTRTQFQVFLESFLAHCASTKVTNVKVDSQTDDTLSHAMNVPSPSNDAVCETDEDVPVSSVVDANSPHAQNEPNDEIRIENTLISKDVDTDIDGVRKDFELGAGKENTESSSFDSIGRS